MIEGAMNLVENETTISATHLPSRFFNEKRNTSATPIVQQNRDVVTLHQPESIDEKSNLKNTLLNKEKQHIINVLNDHNGNITQAAKKLGISRQNLQYRIRKFNLLND
jgi:arginine utilization regulatory protein